MARRIPQTGQSANPRKNQHARWDYIGTLCCLLLQSACGGEPSCELHPDDPGCGVAWKNLSVPPNTFVFSSSKLSLDIKFKGEPGYLEVLALKQRAVPALVNSANPATYSTLCSSGLIDNSDNYKIFSVIKNNENYEAEIHARDLKASDGFDLGELWFCLNQKDPLSGKIYGPQMPIWSNLQLCMMDCYTASAVTAFMQSYPTVEYLGFAGTKLIALRSGLDGSSYPSKIIRRYAWMNNQLADAEVTGDYFNLSSFGNKSLAATASMTGSVFVLRAVMTTGLELRKCDAAPGDGTNCTVYAPLLPLDTQAFAVSADGTVGVVADKDGRLSYARLDQATPLSWQGFGETPSVGSVVKLAMGDVNGDGMVDVVRVGAAGGTPQAGVLLGSESGFSQNSDSGLSTALVEAIGDPAVDALAVGDLDQDGWAEVLVANGPTVHVLYNQRGRFVDVQKLTLGPGPGDGGPKVTAIGIGKLEGTVDPSKLLDIVVASNGPPDAMTGIGKFFFQAFRY